MSWPVFLNIFKAVAVAQFTTLFIILSVERFKERLLLLFGIEVANSILPLFGKGVLIIVIIKKKPQPFYLILIVAQ